MAPLGGLRKRWFAWLLSRLVPKTEAKWGLDVWRQKLMAHVPEGSTVVELGIGTGPNLRFYGDRAARVIGIDPNTFMQRYARDAAAAAGLPPEKLELSVGRAEALPLPDGCADAVVCTHVLCSVADVDGALAEAARVLRPGGKLIFMEHVAAGAAHPGLRRLQAVVNPVAGLVGDGCHVTRDALARIQAASFSAVEAERFDVAAATWLQAAFRPHVAGVAVR